MAAWSTAAEQAAQGQGPFQLADEQAGQHSGSAQAATRDTTGFGEIVTQRRLSATLRNRIQHMISEELSFLASSESERTVSNDGAGGPCALAKRPGDAKSAVRSEGGGSALDDGTQRSAWTKLRARVRMHDVPQVLAADRQSSHYSGASDNVRLSIRSARQKLPSSRSASKRSIAGSVLPALSRRGMLFAQLRNVVSAARTDPVIAAQQSFLAHLARVRCTSHHYACILVGACGLLMHKQVTSCQAFDVTRTVCQQGCSNSI